MDDRGTSVRFPAEAGNVTVRHSVHTGCETSEHNGKRAEV